jgi:hypothetical protein
MRGDTEDTGGMEMKTETEIRERINWLKSDERVKYPPANLFSNGPLALVQVDIKAQISALEWALDSLPSRKEGE